MNSRPDDVGPHDPELQRLFAGARVALPPEPFGTSVVERLTRARRRRLFMFSATLGVALAALAQFAPRLISGSLALSALMGGQAHGAGSPLGTSLVWVASLLIGAAVVLRTRRLLRR